MESWDTTAHLPLGYVLSWNSLLNSNFLHPAYQIAAKEIANARQVGVDAWGPTCSHNGF